MGSERMQKLLRCWRSFSIQREDLERIILFLLYHYLSLFGYSLIVFVDVERVFVKSNHALNKNIFILLFSSFQSEGHTWL